MVGLDFLDDDDNADEEEEEELGFFLGGIVEAVRKELGFLTSLASNYCTLSKIKREKHGGLYFFQYALSFPPILMAVFLFFFCFFCFFFPLLDYIYIILYIYIYILGLGHPYYRIPIFFFFFLK